MIILTIRTDNPRAEVGIYDAQQKRVYREWEAHRELSGTLHKAIEELLSEQHLTWQDIAGIVCFQGPGSFTGLRIGMSVANALSYSLHIPIVATMDEDWITKGIERLMAGEQDEIALPFYGRDANITVPKK